MIAENIVPDRPAPKVDRRGLEKALRKHLEGEVRFDEGSRALYATDGSNYRQVPMGVVVPRGIDDVVTTVALCREFAAPLLSRGGGTSLTGACCNVAVVMDMSKHLHRIIELDPQKRTAKVEPGVVLDVLRNRAERYHLTFAPDPSTHNHCTLGGMIGNNSCGVHSMMGGRTVDNVHELDVLTYDGLRLTVGKTGEGELEAIIREGGRRGALYNSLKELRDRYSTEIRRRFPRIPRRVSGYSIDELLPENGFHVARSLVGAEGSLVTLLSATVRLVPSPPARSLLVLGFSDIYAAADRVPVVLESNPCGLEGIDDRLVNDMQKKGLHKDDLGMMPSGSGWLLVEFGGETKQESDQKARRLMAKLKQDPNPPQMHLYDNDAQEKKLWKIRESGLGATAFLPGSPDTWEGWEDSAVPPEKLGVYLRKLRELLNKYHYSCSLYGHFGQGCVHTRIDFDLVTYDGIKKYRSFMEEAAHLVTQLGGSLSGEHGDGQSRAELLPLMYGPTLIKAFKEFKAIWDPNHKMNPGKKIDAYPLDSNLRLGTDYQPSEPLTHFKYPDDKHSFARASLRCVGVGECRRMEGGTMCPSYRVTREEMHSTRGRAHLLFEILHGGFLKKQFKDKHVREALDLCLACKGCKGDCPVNVDIASYKAEFLAHFYKRRLRPRSAYSMGLIHYWARWASKMPRLANWMGHAPLVAEVTKWVGGISPQRKIPPFAADTFMSWWSQRPRIDNPHKPAVMLWPDTFNNFFRPETAKAAVKVLEAAGFAVSVPDAFLCCGRPLYDFGMLELAKKQLLSILETLRPHIRAGVPLVGLEPSCTAVFRDELINLFPSNMDAKRLNAQTFFFSEFLEKRAPHFSPPSLNQSVIAQIHCHQKALIGSESVRSLLNKMGAEVEVPEEGCCGMAGSFGFESKHFAISQEIANQRLIPAIQKASPLIPIVANGFSCREQIEQATSRKVIHIAELIEAALDRALLENTETEFNNHIGRIVGG